MRSPLRQIPPTLGSLLILVLSACETPVELQAEKQDYVGAWTSPFMCLTITEQGSVSYERVRMTSTTTIRGPIKEFVGDDFVVGFWFIETTFKVEQPPYHDGATWRMKVDGVELVKTDSPSGCQPVERASLEEIVVACLRWVSGGQ
jgi:hypothetical protein